MAKILIVDDEKDIRELLLFNLQKEGFIVLTAQDGAEAMQVIEQQQPDLVILDWMLPILDGIEVCKKIRQNPTNHALRIIMVSAKSEEFDKVLALELGADDYVSKPFSIRELIARIKAQLRQHHLPSKIEDKEVLRFPELIIDTKTYEVTFRNKVMAFTKTEFQLLHALASQPKRVFTREQLLYKVWGQDFYGDDRVVDVHIRRLRSKFEALAAPEYVQTVRGVGYKFSY